MRLGLHALIAGLAFAAAIPQAKVSGAPEIAGYTSICTIHFDKDAQRPARVQDAAAPCLREAAQKLRDSKGAKLYLVATADQARDNDASHGHARTEQDMSGEDLRYADVAAYRSINTKAYMTQWLNADTKRIVPLTAYENGQWVAVFLVPDHVNFKRAYGQPTAPILVRPCTVAPCASGPEEFLLAQPRTQIGKP